MPSAIPQDAHRRTLLEQTQDHTSRVRSLDSLSREQLMWQPPTGGWSIAQVLEHLLVSNESYLPMMDRFTRETSLPAQPGEEWKPSLFGGLLIKSMTSPRRYKAPKLYRDVLDPRDNALRAFVDQLGRLARILDAADRVSWRRTRTTSPVSKLIRLNLGDCFAVLPAHTARHLDQIDRVRAHPEFPSVPTPSPSALRPNPEP